MSAADATPPELMPDERAEIRRRFAKALLYLGLGILLPLIYFWALIAWLVSGLDHAASSETISLTFGIGLYLRLGGMADCLIYAYYYPHPGTFHNRHANHRLWLLTPPSRDWPRKFDEEGNKDEFVNRPLRLLHASIEWLYIEGRLIKAKTASTCIGGFLPVMSRYCSYGHWTWPYPSAPIKLYLACSSSSPSSFP